MYTQNIKVKLLMSKPVHSNTITVAVATNLVREVYGSRFAQSPKECMPSPKRAMYILTHHVCLTPILKTGYFYCFNSFFTVEGN